MIPITKYDQVSNKWHDTVKARLYNKTVKSQHLVKINKANKHII